MSSGFENVFSPKEEMIAYETLWALTDQTTRRLAELFQRHGGPPSTVLAQLERELLFPEHHAIRAAVEHFLASLSGFSVTIHGAFQYPEKLRAAKYPIELFYYRGDIGLAESSCVSVVGSRKPSPEGLRRAQRVARGLVDAGFTIVSGLAAGIDTAAMTAAMDAHGRTIGVIGTPINQAYPIENQGLQDRVASDHLLISQVPFYRHRTEPFSIRRRYFPERNITMAALSRATVIVEASDTSGTLTQARAALQQNRKLFILNSCFDVPGIRWPNTYEARGAIRVRELDDLLSALAS